MRLTSHATCAPIVEINPGGTVRVSRMEYTWGDRTSIRHIMETGKNGQTIMKTLMEGVFKEGAKDRENFQVDVLADEPVHIEFVPDEKHDGGTQIKVVFPVYVRPDQLRDFTVPDDDNPSEVHGPITLVEVLYLLRSEGSKFIPFHKRATFAVLAWAASEKSVFNRYIDTISEWNPPKLTDEQKEAIAAYPARW